MRRARPAKALPPVGPNAGHRVAYSRKLCKLVEEMARSYERWITAAYRSNPPLAQDEVPARALERLLSTLGLYWRRRFEAMAPKLATWFATSIDKRSTAVLKKVLRDGGLTVKFKMTPELKDVMAAAIAENVSLIKSIPQQYHTEVEGLVMRSVSTGRDLRQLTRDLRKRYPITEKRARLIALDQNNKATSMIQRTRQAEAGIEEGVWMHSHAGKEPRRTHLANDGNTFSIKAGWFDPDPKVRKRIWPGELINCRCTWKPIVEGFS